MIEQTHPLRMALAGLVVVGLLLAVVAALTGLLVVIALVVCLAVLNLVYLPRAARRLRIPAGWLALTLIPFMILIGVVVDGIEGAAWAIGLWLVAIGLPRAIGRDLLHRAGRGLSARVTYYDARSRTVSKDDVMKPTRDPAGRPLPPADGPGRGEYGL
jgi:hypothetical protein